MGIVKNSSVVHLSFLSYDWQQINWLWWWRRWWWCQQSYSKTMFRTKRHNTG